MSIRYANIDKISIALAVFLAHDSYEHNSDPNTISVTTLLKPIRQIVLPSRVPEGEGLINLASMVSSRIGTAIHNGIENAWDVNNYPKAMQALGLPQSVIDKIVINPILVTSDQIPVYLEQRVSKQTNGWIITGKYDFIAEGRVRDFKSTSVWTYKNQVNKNKYIEQGSIYRWLNPEIITQDIMDIDYIFTDWKAASAKQDPSYPNTAVHTQSFNLLSLNQTQLLITNKLAQIDKYWKAEETDIPYCTDEELWRSDPVYKYYKKGDINAPRSTKNFDTPQAAAFYMSTEGKGTGAIKEVPGQVMACKYCAAFNVCTQKDLLIENGQLLMYEDIKKL